MRVSVPSKTPVVCRDEYRLLVSPVSRRNGRRRMGPVTTGRDTAINEDDL